MPSNVIVNTMTTQHKMSVGITSAFPDVCKTPAPPAPLPVPIPYPNVANSVMASEKVTKKVSDNKQKVVVQGSAYSLSNGDQPGVALGVVSNKIMGKSYIKNQSFDVKFEGKGVGRLTDPHGNNCGSDPPNTVAPAEAQGPMVGLSAQADQAACDRLAKKKVPDDKRAETAEKYGMLPEHAEAMSSACVETGMSATARSTNPNCMDKIRDGFATKPAGAEGKTISDPFGLPSECQGLVGISDKSGLVGVNSVSGVIGRDELNSARSALGPEGFTDWLKNKKGAMTGDYDMHDVFDKGGKRATNASRQEGHFINSVNDAIGRTDPNTRMVQHGPQANVKEFFDANPEKAAEDLEKFKEKKFREIQQPDLRKTPPEPVLHFDNNGNMYEIESEEELKDLYACKGADYPEHWK